MKILVVEDEPRIAQALKKGLTQERFTVDIAATGDEGYDLAASEPYDLIILDLMLPGMDGLTICQKLRQNEITTPILMLTAKGQLDDKVAGLDSGADDYLTKPFAFEELLARVRALSRRPPTLTEAHLIIGNLTLDPVRFSVERAGQPLTLSPKEFALLEYLMRHSPHPVTKQQIISQVWDYDADILPNTIEVTIRNLRKKIAQPTDQYPLIKTIRGFGYKIDA